MASPLVATLCVGTGAATLCVASAPPENRAALSGVTAPRRRASEDPFPRRAWQRGGKTRSLESVPPPIRHDEGEVTMPNCGNHLRFCDDVRPGKDDHAVRLPGQRPAVEAAADLPAGEAGDPQQQGHLVLVHEARAELGPVNDPDGPVVADGLDLVDRVLDLFDTVQSARVIHPQQLPGRRM